MAERRQAERVKARFGKAAAAFPLVSANGLFALSTSTGSALQTALLAFGALVAGGVSLFDTDTVQEMRSRRGSDEAPSKSFAASPRARALLRGKEMAAKDLAESGGSYTLEDVRLLLNSVSRQSIEKRVRDGRLLAVAGPNNKRFYPVAQFHDDGSVVEGLSEVQGALATRDGYAVLNFLVNPDPRLALDEMSLSAGAVIYRFYNNAYEPLFYDRSSLGRMNAPDGGYCVLYDAESVAGAFAETFLRTPGRTLLPLDIVRRKSFVRLRLTRPVRLVKFFGPGLAKLGATAEVTHGGLPYDAPQAWSAALHALTPPFDGIAFRARHDDDAICYALYDRASPHVVKESDETDIDKDWFWSLAEISGVGLAPDSSV